MKSLYYFSNSVLPSKTADSINVMNTSSKLAASGLNVFTSGVKGARARNKKTFKFYGVSANFKLLRYQPIVKKGSLRLSALLDIIRIKRLKPDYIYGRSIFTAQLLNYFKIPFVFECHDAKWLKNSKYEKMYTRVMESPYLLKLVVVSDRLLELTCDKYPRFIDKPIAVIRNGASLPPAVDSDYSENKIGYVGGFYAGRGLNIIVEIAQKMSNHSFYLAGGTASDLKKLLKRSSLPENIHCLGYISPNETAQFRASMALLLAPYQLKTKTIGGTDTTAYMSPIKIFEYMSSRTPIISSDLPVIREVLNDRNSYLVKANDVLAWKDAIQYLINNPNDGKRLSDNAYAYFVENLTWESRAQKIKAFLES